LNKEVAKQGQQSSGPTSEYSAMLKEKELEKAEKKRLERDKKKKAKKKNPKSPPVASLESGQCEVPTCRKPEQSSGTLFQWIEQSFRLQLSLAV